MRLSIAAVVVSMVFVTIATAVVPVRVHLEPTSFTCRTVLDREPSDLIASAACRKAGAYRLRATFGIAALLTVLSFLPLVIKRRAGLFVWAGAMIGVAIGSVIVLAAVGARLEGVFFDL